jgi:transcriptional regulator of arginine metabolism
LVSDNNYFDYQVSKSKNITSNYKKMDKESRIQEIKKIISSRKISGQDSLLEALSELGYEITQATLSRDLKEIGIAKIPDPEFGYIYVLPQRIGVMDRKNTAMSHPGESIVSIEFSYNFGIIKTYPGFASSVAIFIDSSKDYAISATIAGDDAILVIPRQPATEKELRETLYRLFPNTSM